MATTSRTRFLADLAAARVDAGPAQPIDAWVAAVLDALVRQRDLPFAASETRFGRLSLAVAGVAGAAPRIPALPPHAPVEVLGQAHEVLVERGQRRTRGVFYTPAGIAGALVDLALVEPNDRDPGAAPTILDPAVGGGAFLLAAGRALEARGFARDVIVADALWGIDIDPLAIAVTEAMLWLWAAETGSVPRGSHLAVADTLLAGCGAFEASPPAGFDTVVGNPPFLNQLGAATALTPAMRAERRARLGASAFRYADAATLFLRASVSFARPGGRVSLIVPQSVLVADDARGARDEILERADLEHLWVADRPVFAAGVRVCAPVLRVKDASSRAPAGATAAASGASELVVARSRGPKVDPAPPAVLDEVALRDAGTWGPLLADLFGVPALDLTRFADRPTLASFCAATAGFRDQYYGLAGFVREATPDEIEAWRGGRPPDDGRDVAPLVTSGLIDVAGDAWGRRATRFAKQRWEAPLVDLAGLRAANPALATWADDRLVPKVVVATQTRVLEATVDERGRCFPSVPTIALSCPPARLWHAAAVVLAPAITVWALHRHTGAALSGDAVKVSAKQLLRAPLPEDDEAWDRAASCLRAAAVAGRDGRLARAEEALREFAAATGAAYGLSVEEDDRVTAWWSGRRRGHTEPGRDDEA